MKSTFLILLSYFVQKVGPWHYCCLSELGVSHCCWLKLLLLGVWRKKIPSFPLWSWHAHFTLHLDPFLSYLSTSVILRAKFSFSWYLFSETRATTNLSPLSLSLIVHGVDKKHLGSKVLQKRMRKIKLDNRNNSRETHSAMEQNEYQWKFYIKYMFLGIFRNKNGTDSIWTLL